MLQMAGEVQRLPAPQLRAGSIEQTSIWLDLAAGFSSDRTRPAPGFGGQVASSTPRRTGLA